MDAGSRSCRHSAVVRTKRCRIQSLQEELNVSKSAAVRIAAVSKETPPGEALDASIQLCTSLGKVPRAEFVSPSGSVFKPLLQS